MIVLPPVFNAGDTLYLPFDTYDASGGSVTISGFAVTDIEIYKNGSTTQRASDNGYALLDTDGIDFDGVTGLHGFSIDTSDNSDAGFWADGNQYWININAITVDGQTVRFTYFLALGYSLRPTTAGRKLDVSVGGEAGIDFANIGSPTTTVNLSGTTISTSQQVASVSGAVGSVTGAVGSVTGNIGGNVVGSVASVTAAVTVGTNNDKTGYSLSSTGLNSIVVSEPAGEAQWGTTTLVGALGVLLTPLTNKNFFTRTSSTAGTITQRNNADNASLWTRACTDTGSVSTIGNAI